jgi:hypothetical protein
MAPPSVSGTRLPPGKLLRGRVCRRVAINPRIKAPPRSSRSCARLTRGVSRAGCDGAEKLGMLAPSRAGVQMLECPSARPRVGGRERPPFSAMSWILPGRCLGFGVEPYRAALAPVISPTQATIAPSSTTGPLRPSGRCRRPSFGSARQGICIAQARSRRRSRAY